MHEEETRRLAERSHDRSATDTGIDDLALTSNWIPRTGWPSTFAGVKRRLLQVLSQSPACDGRRLHLGDHGARTLYSSADDEQRLSRIGLAVDHFLNQCPPLDGGYGIATSHWHSVCRNVAPDQLQVENVADDVLLADKTSS